MEPDQVTEPTTTQSTTRRSVLTAGIWTAPAAVFAMSLPAAAASPGDILQVDLASTARIPMESADGVYLGDNYYQGVRTLSYRITYSNAGPDDLPAGGIITFGLPFGAIWVSDSLVIQEDSAGKNPVFLETNTTEIGTDPLALRRNWHFVLSSAVAAGTSFDIVFQIQLTATRNAATNNYRVRTYSNFAVGATDANDINLGNNTGFSSNYAYYNNLNASGA